MNDFVPSADPTTLMGQAHRTACTYMIEAIGVDESFGEGHAKKHPELVAAFMKTAATDFHTAILAKAVGGICEAIENSSSGICEAVDGIYVALITLLTLKSFRGAKGK